MDAVSLIRLRWRLRGAWMWPSFVVLTLVDGAIVHWLPPVGDRGSPIAGWLGGWIYSLVGIVVLTPPLGWVIRRVRPDMPRVVARDYAGAGVCVAVTLSVLAGGLVHRHVVNDDKAALQDATARAEAYIGDRAPAAFQALQGDRLETFEVQPPQLYRVCAGVSTGVTAGFSPDPGYRWYCVVVDRSKPFGQGVKYDGSEPNSLLSQGTS
jgi:hypothetical protein